VPRKLRRNPQSKRQLALLQAALSVTRRNGATIAHIVGTITAYKHRGWVRVVMTANTGKVLGMDLDVTYAMIFLWQLEAGLSQKS